MSGVVVGYLWLLDNGRPKEEDFEIKERNEEVS
jgi:hypothetical protein